MCSNLYQYSRICQNDVAPNEAILSFLHILSRSTSIALPLLSEGSDVSSSLLDYISRS